MAKRGTEGSKEYGLVRRNLASVFGGLAREVEINLMYLCLSVCLSG